MLMFWHDFFLIRFVAIQVPLIRVCGVDVGWWVVGLGGWIVGGLGLIWRCPSAEPLKVPLCN